MAWAQTREEFTAFGVNMNAGRADVVDIVIDTWSPDGDRETLLKVLADKGQDEMLKELKRPRLGYIRLPNTLGHDIHYAVQQPLSEGGRRVIVVTDRPIGFAEARNNSRSMDYPFTMVEFRFTTAGAARAGCPASADRVCLFSDGVPDQTGRSDEPFGANRLREALVARRTVPAEQVVTDVVADLTAWADPGSFEDDVSLVVIDWAGEASRAAGA